VHLANVYITVNINAKTAVVTTLLIVTRYIMSKKPDHFDFCSIFDFCWQLLTFFSLLQSEMISVHIWNKIYHLALTALCINQ